MAERTPVIGPDSSGMAQGEIMEPVTASQAKTHHTANRSSADRKQVVPEIRAHPRSTDGRVWGPGAYTEHPPEIEKNYVE